MSKLLLASALAGAALLAPMTASAASYTFVRAGGTSAAQQSDIEACDVRGQARARAARIQPVGVYTPNLAALGAVALIQGVQEGVHTARERTRGVDACMRARGWTRLELTADEAAALAAAGNDAAQRGRWLDGFMAAVPAERVAVAAKPAVPQLKTAAAQPYAVGGLVLDPDSLKASEQVLAKGDVVVAGRARRRLTAKLLRDFSAASGATYSVPAGATAFAVEDRPAPDPEEGRSSLWCLPAREKALLASGDVLLCVASTFDEYAGFVTRGETWMASVDGYKAPVFIKAGELALEEAQDDPADVLTFQMRLRGLSKRAAVLEAVTERAGKRVVVWRGDAKFDAAGQTVVPFWTAKLMMKRDAAGKSLTASWSPEGDGRGWNAPDGD